MEKNLIFVKVIGIALGNLKTWSNIVTNNHSSFKVKFSVGNCNFLLIKYNYPDTLYLSEKYGVSHWISIITFLNNNVYLTFFNFSVWLFSGCLPIENWRIFVYLQVNHLNVHLRNNETQVSSPIHGALRVQGKNNTCFSAVFRYTSIDTVLDLENWIP